MAGILSKATSWENLSRKEEKTDDITSIEQGVKESEILELKIRVKKLEIELAEMKKIMVEVERKSKKSEKKVTSGEAEKKNASKDLEKAMEEREETMRKCWNEQIQELHEVNSSYEKAIVQECEQFMHIVARTKSEARIRYKIPLWEIDPDYSLRVIKGEEWSDVKCLKWEVDK